MQSVHTRLDIGPNLFQCNLNIWDQLAPTLHINEAITSFIIEQKQENQKKIMIHNFISLKKKIILHY